QGPAATPGPSCAAAWRPATPPAPHPPPRPARTPARPAPPTPPAAAPCNAGTPNAAGSADRRPRPRLLLPTADLVRRSRRTAHAEDGGGRGGRLDLSGHRRLDAYHAACGHGHALAVERRHHLAGMDEVDLLLAGLALVVLGDQHLARVLRDGVDAERRDAEVVPDRLPRLRPVRLHRRHVVHRGHLPAGALRCFTHATPPKLGWRRSYSPQ